MPYHQAQQAASQADAMRDPCIELQACIATNKGFTVAVVHAPVCYGPIPADLQTRVRVKYRNIL